MAAFVYDGVIYHTREPTIDTAMEYVDVIHNNKSVKFHARIVAGRITHIKVNTPDGPRTVTVSPARRYKLIMIIATVVMILSAGIISYAGYNTNSDVFVLVLSALIFLCAAMVLYANIMIICRLHRISPE